MAAGTSPNGPTREGCGTTAGPNSWEVTGAMVEGTMMGAAMWGREGLKREAGGLGMSLNIGLDVGPRCLEKSSKPPRAMGPVGDATDTDGGTVLK